ncbi:hypothetical protein [Streptomyces sp. NPDC030920]|uniref:hypothetical protein n=1 Tax=Streptomyces sp. NPDC030920 TaxID=3365308 RepID=UPI00384FDA9F
MHNLVGVAPVNPEGGKVAQHGDAATQRQRLGEGCGEGVFSEVGAAELEVAGSSFLGEAGTIEPEPAAVVGVATEKVHPVALWDESERSLVAWQDAGTPDIDTIRLRVTADSHLYWTDRSPSLRWGHRLT